MLLVDVRNNLIERRRRDLGREALDLLQDEVTVDEPVDGLELDGGRRCSDSAGSPAWTPCC